MTRPLTPSEIADWLARSRQQQRSDNQQDQTMAKLTRLLQKLDPYSQMQIICAYQATLILELANNDKEKATVIWQTAWKLSADMLKDFHDKIEQDGIEPETVQ